MLARLFDAQWKRILTATFIFFLISIIYTFPLIVQLDTHIPGYGSDINYYYWAHWWFNEAVERGVSVWHTDMQWYPNGTSLVFSTNRFGSAFLGYLLTPLFGQIAAYNIVILLSYVLSALGVYLLVRFLTRHELASYLAAYVFAFNPFKLHVMMHHHFLLDTFVFGFSAYLLFRILTEDGWHWWKGVSLGALFAFMFYDSIFLAVFLFLTLATIFLGVMIARWKQVWQVRKMATYVLVVAVALVLMAPQIVEIVQAVPEYGGLPSAPGVVSYSNDLLHLVWPSPLLLSAPGQHTGEFFGPGNQTYRTAEENFGMPGWFVLIAAFTGWWLNRKQLFANIAFGGTLFFYLLSLGPKLWVGGEMTNVPMLYGLLQWIPFFSMIRTPNRFVLVGFLFAGVLAGYAVKSLCNAEKKPLRVGAVALAVLIFLDYIPLGVDTQDQYDVPEPVKILREAKMKAAERPAVLHANIGYRENMRYAAFHEKPMTSGYTSRTTLFSRPLQDFSVSMVLSLDQYASQFPNSGRLNNMSARVRKILKYWGIGAILYKGETENAERIAHLLHGELKSSDEDFHLVMLNAIPAEEPGVMLSAETWPKMPWMGLEMGEFSQVMWCYEKGFVLTLPDELMPEKTLKMRFSSTLRSPDRFRHAVDVYMNRELIDTVELGFRTRTVELKVPDSIRRLPVNIFTFRNRVNNEKERNSFPFSTEIISANTYAGNTAGLAVNGRALLEHNFYDKNLFFATSTDGKQLTLHAPVNPYSDEAEAEINRLFDSLAEERYLIIFTSGNLTPKAVDALTTRLEELGMPIKKKRLRNRSLSLLADLKKQVFHHYYSRNSITTLFINKGSRFYSPLLNIEYLTFN